MHALRYFLSEAGASLWRGRGASALAILTIAIGMFVLGFFLIANANFQHVVDRWSESAELSVYLEGSPSADQLTAIEEMVDRSGLTARREYVSNAQALERFRADFPDLAGSAGTVDDNPFPASIELQLRSEVRDATGAVDGLVSALAGMPGVADVRYDRQWLARLNTVVRSGRLLASGIVAMLVFAAAMTVGNVVRLTVAARRDEIEIMQLVGAPYAYVRGPFVTEGILQGGLGALLALAGLALTFVLVRTRFAGLTFLPWSMAAALLMGGMLLGFIGGYVVARGVR